MEQRLQSKLFPFTLRVLIGFNMVLISQLTN